MHQLMSFSGAKRTSVLNLHTHAPALSLFVLAAVNVHMYVCMYMPECACNITKQNTLLTQKPTKVTYGYALSLADFLT